MCEQKRELGTLLPVFSLPSPYGIGTLGRAALDFVDFLAGSGQRVWQLLPVGPTGCGNSPYQALSSFAGNPWFIDPDILFERGLLTRTELPEKILSGNVDYSLIFYTKNDLLRRAFTRFSAKNSYDFSGFCDKNASWLEDYALYMALKERFGLREWQSWPEELRLRRPEALRRCRDELRDETEFWKFTQFEFEREWKALKRYAEKSGVLLMGDIPFYAAPDSADTWSRDIFITDAGRRPTLVAGVPPDYFSKTGQLWGNFLYDWDSKKDACLGWWRERTARACAEYDIIRIDHFIGAVRYWAVPFGAPDAVNGTLGRGPCAALAEAIDRARGSCAIVAEDLGAVTPEVRALMERHGYPGMRILQFAFDGESSNEHLPPNVGENNIMYTGTHDNDTAEGFLSGEGKALRARFPSARTFIDFACSSRARLAVIPMQDWLGLGSEARTNTPSTVSENWKFRVADGALTAALREEIRDCAAKSGRLYGRATGLPAAK